MNIAVVIDIDTSRETESKVIVQQVNRTDNDKLIPTDDTNQIELMSALCEGISLLIHTAHKSGIKEDYKSVEDCTKHIQLRFADASYVAKTEKTVEKILIEPLNAKIEIAKNEEEDCWDYTISNINKIERRYDDFHVSYAFYSDSLENATIEALKDLFEKYNEYLDFIS